MKILIAFSFLLLSSMNTFGQKKYNYKTSALIFEHIISTIDSAFKLKLETTTRDNFKMIRIIDKTGKFFLANSGYWQKIPLIIIDRYPYDVNTQGYLDIISVTSILKDNIETVTVISIINRNCYNLPISVTQSFKIDGDKVFPFKTVNITVLDDWNPYPKD